MLFRRIALSLLLAQGIGIASVQAQVPDYGEFQLQARTNLLINDAGFNLPPGSSFNSVTPSINDAGWVAFPVQLVTEVGNPAASGTGIWHGRDGAGAIAHHHASGAIATELGINAAGEVAYRIKPDVGNDVIWLYDPVTMTATPVGVLPLTPTGISSVSLSADRVVGYQATFGGNRAFASTAAFATPVDSVVHAYDRNLDPTNDYAYLYTPAMNNARVIAGKVSVVDFNHNEIRLFQADGSSVRVVADQASDPSSPFDRFDNGLAVNDAGAVAVALRIASGGVRAVYRFDAAGATEIARIGGGGPILEIDSFRPAINNAGLVAFRARDAQGQAVYVGDGSSLRRVIGNGDAIQADIGAGQLGQHDTSAVFGGAPSINNHGDVVVAAGLHPAGNNQIEWGTGIIVAKADRAGAMDPLLALTPDAFEITVAAGASASETLTVANAGGGELAWQVETGSDCAGGPSADWLSVQGSGVLDAGESAGVTLTIDASDLVAGSHDTVFCIDAADNADGSYWTLAPVTVSIQVQASGLPVYTQFELQARTNLLVNDNGFNLPPGSSFNSITPVLNNAGWVSFPVQLVTHEGNPTQSGTGVWHGRRAEGGIVHRHDNDAMISSEVAINSAGDVVYRLRPDVGNDQVWLYDPATDNVAAVGLLPLTPTSVSSLSLSDSRRIGYQAIFGTGRGFASTTAFATPADSVVHVYDNSLDGGSPYNYLYTPAMNNQRVIAGKVNVGVGTDYTRQEIRLFNADGSSERVAANVAADPQSPFSGFDNSLDINDSGQVVVTVNLAAGNVRAVYRFDADGPVEIARVGAGGITEIQFFRPVINNAGLVAFRASDAQGQAVFVGDGNGLRRVIGRGDLIAADLGDGQLGQHDTSPVFGGAPGINDHGDVVVSAGLHPAGNNQVEWGNGIIVAWAERDEPTEPSLLLTPESFAFTVVEGDQASDTLSVANAGGGELAWLVETGSACTGGPSAPWLSVAGGGVLGTGEDASVSVTVDGDGLTPGTYETVFCIDAVDNAGGSYQRLQPVPVTLMVEAAPIDDRIFANGFESTQP